MARYWDPVNKFFVDENGKQIQQIYKYDPTRSSTQAIQANYGSNTYYNFGGNDAGGGNYAGGSNAGAGASGSKKVDTVYSPNLREAYDKSDNALDKYFSSLKSPGEIGSLTQGLDDVGAYQGYDWENPLTGYDPTSYNYDVESVSPLAQSLYEAQEGKARKEVSKSYQDAKAQVLDEVYRNRNRPEQAAALLAELGVQEGSATDERLNDIRFQQAQQELGIAQQEQGLNLDNARYAHEQQLSDEQYQMGVNQWLQEQQAAEEQAKYQSAYGLAQDKNQAMLSEFETNRAADLDYSNALLQGQQAGANQFAQAGTYYTNLSEDERKNSRLHATQPSTKSSYGTGYSYKMPNQKSTTTKQSPYKMPTASKSGVKYG